MKYIKELREGDRVSGVYFCKKKDELISKVGKPYFSVLIQDKTGSLDAKVWDVNSGGIREFDALDFVDITGSVTVFQGNLQLKLESVRKVDADVVDLADFMPTTQKDIEEMYAELLKLLGTIKNVHLKAITDSFFVEDEAFISVFKKHSAAKSVHHGFIGGLLEHTLNVTKAADYYASQYPILNRDLLLAAAALHDIGKVTELTTFPENDYSDEGQLLGHIYVGAEMIGKKCALLGDIPVTLENELKHCILAHHGKLEYGSPKKPAIMEALALSYVDDMDAKLETFKEALEAADPSATWLGYNKLFESNVRKATGVNE